MSDFSKLEWSLRRVTKHHGTWKDFKWRLASAAKKAVLAGPEGRKRYAKRALKMIADERNMFLAMEHIRTFGGGAPGLNGVTFEDYPDESCRWAQCRDLRDAIMEKKILVDGEWQKRESYRPGDVRPKKVPKASGEGWRTISIQNLEDRVVCRGVKQVLEPILDPMFTPNSFGYRPRRNRSHAMLRAIDVALSQRRLVWVRADIKDAFDHVPLQPVLDLIQRHLPSEELQRFLGRCLYGDQRKLGLLQGSSFSPLCLNLYLHHKLDRAWRKRCPQIPLIRYADDIVLLARSLREAKKARQSLDYLVTSAGMNLKVTDDLSVCNLRRGERATFLGFDCGLVDGQIDVTVAQHSIEKLKDRLLELEGDPNAPKAAKKRLDDWFASQAAAYSERHARSIVREFVRCLREIRIDRKTVDDVPLGRQRDWLAKWEQSHKKWLKQVKRYL